MSGLPLKHQIICQSANTSAACKIQLVGTNNPTMELNAHDTQKTVQKPKIMTKLILKQQNIDESPSTSPACKVKSVGTEKTSSIEQHEHEFIPPLPIITAEHIEAYNQKVKTFGTAYEFIPPLRVGDLLATEDIKEYMQKVKSNGTVKASIEKLKIMPGLRLKHQVSLQQNDKVDPNTQEFKPPLRVGAKLTTAEIEAYMKKVNSVGTSMVLCGNGIKQTEVRLQPNDKPTMDPIAHKFISPLHVEAKLTTNDVKAHMQKVKSVTIAKPAVELDANGTPQTIIRNAKIMNGMRLKHQNIDESPSTSAAACKVKLVGSNKPAMELQTTVQKAKPKHQNIDESPSTSAACKVKSVGSNEPIMELQTIVHKAKIMSTLRPKYQNIDESPSTSAACKVKLVGTDKPTPVKLYGPECIPPMRLETKITPEVIEAYTQKVAENNKRYEERRLAFEKNNEEEEDVKSLYNKKNNLRVGAKLVANDIETYNQKILDINKCIKERLLVFENKMEEDGNMDWLYNKKRHLSTEKSLKLMEDMERSRQLALKCMLSSVERLEELELCIEDVEEKLLAKGINVNTDGDDMSDGDLEHSYEDLMERASQVEALLPQTPKKQDHHQRKRAKISATSTPITKKSIKNELVEKSKAIVIKPHGTHISKTKNATVKEILDTFVADENGMVVLGPNGTTISKEALTAINWSRAGKNVTRKILSEIFDRDTLAFHTLTGKPSPAFIDCNKPMKNQLDPLKVADIIHFVMQHKNITAKEARHAITTKCADENKMFRQRENKKLMTAEK